MLLRARDFEFVFPRPTLVMGILNVTPDSFSDGGRFLDPGKAEERAHELIAQGAEILDVGGESTRPRAEPVSASEELRRVTPVLERLAGRISVPISIDTQKPEVARAALELGASIVNDIGAGRQDEGMWRLAGEFGAGYVAMHMQGTPQTMQVQPVYGDVAGEVREFFSDLVKRMLASGLRPEQIVLDVGIGFGKTVAHNLELLAGLNKFTSFQRPLLVGVSRKSFLGKLLGGEVDERLPAALACSCWMVEAGAQIIRTHDVAETVQAARMIEAILALKR